MLRGLSPVLRFCYFEQLDEIFFTEVTFRMLCELEAGDEDAPASDGFAFRVAAG